MENSGFNEREAPVFNLGISYIQRIDGILTQMMIHRMNKDANQWNDYLGSLYYEIEAKLKEEELGRARKMQNEINLQFRRLKKRKEAISPKLYTALSDYESFLRRMLHEFNLLMPTRDDPRFAAGR